MCSDSAASLPLLSPYLRPVRDGGSLVIDDPIAARWIALAPLEERLVTALWDPSTAANGVGAIAAAFGVKAVVHAFDSLRQRGLVFDDDDACEQHVRQALLARVRDVPLVDQVELTNLCPMHCRFCARGVRGAIRRPTGRMDLALFERLLTQLPAEQRQYHPLELNDFGESLLHPMVDRFVQAATAAGIPTELSVNPSLLEPALADRLLAAGVGRLVISLDGVDDATLVGIRGPAARYGAAERNLDALIERASRRSPPPAIVIQMIDLVANRHQRDAFLDRWGKLGLAFVEAYVKDLDGPDPDTGLETARPTRTACTYPFVSVVILWDGRIVPCCKDADAALVLGDLNDRSLREIWQDAPVRALRQAHLERSFPEAHFCRACPWERGRFAATRAERHPALVASKEPLRW